MATGGPALPSGTISYGRAVKRSDVPFVSLEDYRVFRDVGLRGLDVDGAERPGARDRNGSRNALFAELLFTTGLRRSRRPTGCTPSSPSARR